MKATLSTSSSSPAHTHLVQPRFEKPRARDAKPTDPARSYKPRLNGGTNESDRARRAMLLPGERPLFLADWTDVTFVHYALDPTVLQPHVPFELDLFGGRAYVSLVAFTQRNLRPRLGGKLAARLSAPLATHEFLNARTYVRHSGERGIYFLAEWIPNRLAALVGPPLYGLPYRLAHLRYTGGGARIDIQSPAGRLAWRAGPGEGGSGGVRESEACDSLTHFLLEHYTAFTRRGRTDLRFRVWHEPWGSAPTNVTVEETSILRSAFPWLDAGRPACAHRSPGVFNVWIGPPRRADVAPPAATPVQPRLAKPRPGAPELYLPPAALLATALALRTSLPAWAFMWALCFALFFGCKWITWRRAGPALRRNAFRTLAYFFAWVGMDAPAFLDPSRRPTRATNRDWLAGATKTLIGAGLIWIVPPLLLPHHPLAAGWAAMTGLVLLLHFGAFHLLALLWRRAGVDAGPIMREPARAASLADFWGARWNLGFHRLAHDLVFRPLRRPLGPAGATLATFAASGLVHDLVISVPAGAGYGLPTAYFVAQGLGVLLERSAVWRRFKGRAFTAAVLLAPLPWLFHGPFVRAVALPFLEAIGGVS